MFQSFTKRLFSPKSQELVLRLSILALVYLYAFSIRLYSVLRYESVIHEFDPYFNYRSTIKLVTEGFHEFWNWFDSDSWYPLGRVVGGTVYPGIMITAAAMHKVLTSLSAWVQLRDVCVFTGPFFAGNTALIAYLFGCELRDRGTGLVAAALMSVVPGYISRSVAGSYDNEAVAIFALIATFYLFVRAVRLGTVSAAALAAFAYLYMAASWGAYVFISNLIPLYVLVMIAIRRYHRRLYVAYTTFWAIGGLLAMQVRFIGSNHVTSHELLAFNVVWLGLQAWELLMWLKARTTPAQFSRAIGTTLLTAVGGVVGGVVLLTLTGKMTPWTGRFWTLLDPTYAKKYIPIIASVSEHQPTTWATYVFDVHLLVFGAPAGLYFCFKTLSDAQLFLITFALTAIYFSGIMIRLMLVAAPAFVLLGSIAVSTTLYTYTAHLWEAAAEEADAAAGSAAAAAAAPPPAIKKSKSRSASKSFAPLPYKREMAFMVCAMVCFGLVSYTRHCNWVTSEAYSSPSIVLISGWGPYRVVLDDFREAYYWLRHNTAPDARIMSWWDYGYQITSMANRTVIVDNNTWNNTHIATVGRAMSSNETAAYEIMRKLDVDYVLVIFGGVSGYSSDDINKFLWMVRIGGGVYKDHMQEKDFLSESGEYTIGEGASQTMLDSVMYKTSFYDFDKVMTEQGKPMGYDRVREKEIARKGYELQHLQEAFTSEHWIVRIFSVKDLANRAER
ncbi:Oligosaccharyl transferase STT3 subunit-domain-containing protein [Scenedesmus sp. NREL 46B-D3]|nr:Oligosaccharyl transferase STT3 subunit-domain-containing protein [Scenedesmus sp. NREL 46B-D3]